MVAPTTTAAAQPEPELERPTPLFGGTFDQPPCPLPPDLRSDLAYRRACGRSWASMADALGYHPDALRRATENDPEFPAAQERAWAEVAWEGQADGLRRLRQAANGSDEDRALKAAEILVKYATERRRDDTRITVEKIRAEVAHERVEARVEAHRAKVVEPAFPAWPPFPPEVKETEDERIARVERESAEKASNPPPKTEVYLWGGKHDIGQCLDPDESDVKVRVVPDWSAGRHDRHIIYWVVPETARERCRGTGIYFTADNPEPWATQPTLTP